MTEQLSLEMQVRDSAARRNVVRVLNAIRPRRGKAAAISMHEVARQANLLDEDGEPKTRLVQLIVKFLVEERHLPIGTSPTRPFGYFWIVSDEERRAVRGHFVRRALSNLQHAKAYDSDSIIAPLIGQIEINFPEEAKSGPRSQTS